MTQLFIQWAENEIKEAERELDWLAVVRSNGHSANTERDISYWQGYYDAMNNAAAAYYGPTPLEGEKLMNKLDKEERIAYLKIAFHGYLFRMQRGQYNDARLIADSLRYEAYEWEREEYKERNN